MKLRVLAYAGSLPDLIDDEYTRRDRASLTWFAVHTDGTIVEEDNPRCMCILAKDELHAFQMLDAYRRSQEYEP